MDRSGTSEWLWPTTVNTGRPQTAGLPLQSAPGCASAFFYLPVKWPLQFSVPLSLEPRTLSRLWEGRLFWVFSAFRGLCCSAIGRVRCVFSQFHGIFQCEATFIVIK